MPYTRRCSMLQVPTGGAEVTMTTTVPHMEGRSLSRILAAWASATSCSCEAMRRILVDSARRKSSAKRGGDLQQLGDMGSIARPVSGTRAPSMLELGALIGFKSLSVSSCLQESQNPTIIRCAFGFHNLGFSTGQDLRESLAVEDGTAQSHQYHSSKPER